MVEKKKQYNFRDALGRLQKAFHVLTQAQIAETLGVSKGSVNACIQRDHARQLANAPVFEA